MSRFDIAKLRKEKGMSQGELAGLLQMTQSFLSAIENGKSPLPIEKEERLCEIFNLKNLDEYSLSKKEDGNDKSLNELSDSDLFNQLLSRFHKQAHSSEDGKHHHHHQKIEILQQRIDFLFATNERLMERNDRLSVVNDNLREDIDGYRKEIDRLREEIYLLKSTAKTPMRHN